MLSMIFFKKALIVLLKDGPIVFIKKIINFRSYISSDQYNSSINKQYLIWYKKHFPTQQELNLQKKDGLKFHIRPKISILVPTFNTPKEFLQECLQSIIKQSYDNWELCICDDASSNEKIRTIITEYSKKDKRIKYIFRETNGHISAASNDCLKLATGDFVGMLDHDDFLWPNALYEVVKNIYWSLGIKSVQEQVLDKFLQQNHFTFQSTNEHQ